MLTRRGRTTLPTSSLLSSRGAKSVEDQAATSSGTGKHYCCWLSSRLKHSDAGGPFSLRGNEKKKRKKEKALFTLHLGQRKLTLVVDGRQRATHGQAMAVTANGKPAETKLLTTVCRRSYQEQTHPSPGIILYKKKDMTVVFCLFFRRNGSQFRFAHAFQQTRLAVLDDSELPREEQSSTTIKADKAQPKVFFWSFL